MRYLHGTFQMEEGEVGCDSHTRTMILSPRNKPAVLRNVMNFSGEVKRVGQANIRSRMLAIQNAFALTVPNTGLLHNDGSASAHYLTSTGSTSGINVPIRPSWVGAADGQYTTHRSFRFSVQADYLSSHVLLDDLWAYNETLSFRGNCGPRMAFIELDTGIADVQQVSENTIQSISQRGFATGITDFPTPPPPMYANNGIVELLNPDSAIEYVGPEQRGNTLLQYTVRWNYNFLATEPQSGLPSGA